MTKSNFFSEMISAYDAEIHDLASDSEGKSVLTVRLKEKRQEIDLLLQMVESAPEMVIPLFYQAFSFTAPTILIRAAQCEPDDGDFPTWDDLLGSFKVEQWATSLVDKALTADGGDRFMVTAAVTEFLRLKDAQAIPAPVESESERGDGEDDDDDDESRDLGEAGADWLSEQGFDTRTS